MAAAFPALLVLHAPDEALKGTREPLDGVGPGPLAREALQAQGVEVVRSHFFSNPGQLRAVSKHGRGTCNGEPFTTAALGHGDVLEVEGWALRVLFQPDGEHHHAELEAAVEASPGDEPRALVWADWLVEHGDALGGRIVQGLPRTDDEAARWLGAGAARLRAGDLQLEWRRGFIERAVVRALDTSQGPRGLLALTGQLVRSGAARFLRALELDLASAFPGRVEAGPFDGVETLTALRHMPALPHLERLSLGTFPGWRSSAPLELALEALRRRSPKLVTPAAELGRTAGQAAVEVLVASEPLFLRDELVGSVTALLGGAKVLLYQTATVPTLGLELAPSGGRWLARGPAVRVNGADARSAVLRDGDVLQLGAARLRFLQGVR